MNILLCGADGFLGRAIARRLEEAGHRVLRGVHHPRQPDDIAIDCQRDVQPEVWLPRVQGVDAVINAVGILRERQAGDFARIHHLAPAALFRACAEAGVQRVVQISALGVTDATPYLSSKQAADAALLACFPCGATVLRPSLVFGQEGASTQFFMALASLPLLSIPLGVGKVQPVHVEDVTEAVQKALESPSTTASRVVDFPGARALTYAEWLETYRKLMGLPPAPHLPIPAFVMAATARLAGLFRRSLLCRDTWTMLALGNCGDTKAATALLGRPLREPSAFTPPEAATSLRLNALALWRRPLLLGALATIWFLTALVSAGLFPIQESLALLLPFGLTGTTAKITLAAAVGLDALMGALTLVKPHRRLWLMQLVLIVGYSLLIVWRLPEFLLHPFAPILKNLAVLALLVQLYAEETQA
ncbi:nucleoside-diphosphate sugar epimerase [Betaproteobacteria bacterium]|nr:nucleoside-diphosphate sugar epimerase [Betaproteobacteria bacterium]GHU45389.1 nucleoside-diphosphate sugar epimerase [Betaproteobacteria bacterium]